MSNGGDSFKTSKLQLNVLTNAYLVPEYGIPMALLDGILETTVEQPLINIANKVTNIIFIQ
ncbi:hypothetical protein SHPE106448_09685 [Shewanella pealeana]